MGERRVGVYKYTPCRIFGDGIEKMTVWNRLVVSIKRLPGVGHTLVYVGGGVVKRSYASRRRSGWSNGRKRLGRRHGGDLVHIHTWDDDTVATTCMYMYLS